MKQVLLSAISEWETQGSEGRWQAHFQMLHEEWSQIAQLTTAPRLKAYGG